MLIFFYLIFIFGTSFGLLNIVVGIIVEDTRAAAAKNETKVIRLRDDERARNVNSIQSLFVEGADGMQAAISTHRESQITRAEWTEAVKDPKVLDKLSVVGLPTEGAEGLFDVLSPDGDVMKVEEFVVGVLRLKGESKARDLLELRNFIDKRGARRLDLMCYSPQLSDHEALLRLIEEAADDGGAADAQPRTDRRMLSRMQFERIVNSKRFQKVWQSLDFRPEEALEVFDAIEGASAHVFGVYIEEFVSASLRMRGIGKAKDLVALKMRVAALAKKLKKISATVKRIWSTLNSPPFRNSSDDLSAREERVHRWDRDILRREKSASTNGLKANGAGRGQTPIRNGTVPRKSLGLCCHVEPPPG